MVESFWPPCANWFPARPRLQQAADRAERFLERYGIGRAPVLARFVPLVRTVINPLAGSPVSRSARLRRCRYPSGPGAASLVAAGGLPVSLLPRARTVVRRVR